MKKSKNSSNSFATCCHVVTLIPNPSIASQSCKLSGTKIALYFPSVPKLERMTLTHRLAACKYTPLCLYHFSIIFSMAPRSSTKLHPCRPSIIHKYNRWVLRAVTIPNVKSSIVASVRSHCHTSMVKDYYQFFPLVCLN